MGRALKIRKYNNDTINGGDGNDLFVVALTADHTATESINRFI